MFPHARVVCRWLATSAWLAAVAGGCSAIASSPSANIGADGMVSTGADGAVATGDATACRVGDVATYQSAAYRPATAAWLGVCDAAEISRFYDDCLGPQKAADRCAIFKTDQTTGPCAACIVTADTDTHDGPLISHGTFITTNVAGCIELTDPKGLSCAKALQALGGCELAACQANCPVYDPASRMAYEGCADQASHKGCASYAMASSCVAAERDGGRAADCLISAFPDFYNAVVPLFCGAPPSGLDASTPLTFEASVVDAASGVSADAAIDLGIDALDSSARAADGTTDGPRDGAKD